jgi:hypothetical protein
MPDRECGGAMANIAAQFKAKIPGSLASDTGQRELIGFIKNAIKDQTGLLDCLWEFCVGFRTCGSRRTKMSGVNHSGNIFPSRLIDLSALYRGSDQKGVGNRRVRNM